LLNATGVIAVTDRMNSAAATGEIVTIFIGPQKKRYNIHKDIICHHSEYFRAAYNGRWKEADEGVTLEDVEVEVFHIFVHWLYTQRLPTKSEYDGIVTDADPGKLDDSEKVDGGYGVLKACAFANRFLVADFERITHDFCIQTRIGASLGVSYKYIIFSYQNLPDDSLILKLMVEIQCLFWISSCDEPDEMEIRPELPHKFLIDVMSRHAELRETGDYQGGKLNAVDFYIGARTKEG